MSTPAKEGIRYIEEVLKCKTINHYGTRETWCIAYECPYGRMHVQNELFFAESLDNELVITSFNNRLMPILRYNTHDLANIEDIECPCGKETQVIELNGGRKTDFIYGDISISGELFFKRIVFKLMRSGYDCIDVFKVKQINVDRFIMYVLPKNNFSGIISELIKNYIQKELGKEVELDIQIEGEDFFKVNRKLKVFEPLV